MSITSDDVNYLVYRYLLESGFTHSSFAFANEAAVHTRDYLRHHHAAGQPPAQLLPSMLAPDAVKSARVQPGALIAFLQKGLLYQEVETHTLEDGSSKRCSVPFSLTHPHECIIDKDPLSSSSASDPMDEDPSFSGTVPTSAAALAASSSSTANNDDSKIPNNTAVNNKSAKRDKRDAKKSERTERRSRKDATSLIGGSGSVGVSSGSGAGGSSSMDVSVSNEEDESNLATASEVTIYRPSIAAGDPPVGAVYCIGWNPRVMLLAAGSQDGKVRLWRVAGDSSSEGVVSECTVTLEHANEGEENGVTSLDWHVCPFAYIPQGTLIASGSVNGSVKIWQKSGELKHTLARHTSTVFTLKFNRKGDLLGSASADSTVMIWDTVSGDLRQQFQCHEGAVLDLDWKDDITFATSSSDKHIYVCRMGMLEPMRTYAGHSGDVNAIAWDASAQLLASCSDDHSVKIWTMDTDSSPLFNLSGHRLEVFCLRWAPLVVSSALNTTGAGAGTTTGSSTTNNRILATGSFDSTIRIWDTTTGRCLQVLEKHTSQVSTLSFSADGAFLASGGFDNVFNVWRCRDWSLVKSFRGLESVFEVCWGVKGDKVSVCFNDGVVAVVHLASFRDR
ncbi:hypothetical protein HK100_011293 [Physocladia obscura]|uniref:Anaphase-promoting complex subunit 4-like WD40 domain-containing protein n=1 Tax=Physocladia obscura TaxID=109957 RepID=A0AAD5T1F8_9FUNG|nr:hypothetical protein HK100_011293 [Physocladia obscura]